MRFLGNLLILIFISVLNVYSQINVKDFGAKGDGKSNDTNPIQTAMQKATRENKYLIFSEGTYMVSSLEITTSLKSSSRATIKKINNGKLEKYTFCMIKQQNNLTIENLIFDGNAGFAKTNNLEPTSGSTPLYIIGSKYINLKKCNFVNSSMAGVRVENSTNMLIENCESKNLRGNSGDGFYFTNSNNIEVKNCKASDFSRIGFVTESQSHDFLFENCIAENGHSASKQRGGTEYNGGFWYENSANVITKNCVARNITHRGFVAVTSRKRDGRLNGIVSKFDFINCKSIDIPQAFQVTSQANTPVLASYVNCEANSAVRGFIAKPNSAKDLISYDKCVVRLNNISANPSNTVGFMWGNTLKGVKNMPKIVIKNCEVIYPANTNYETIISNKINTGDLGTYEGGEVNIEIKNFKNSFNKKSIIKNRKGKPQYQFSN